MKILPKKQIIIISFDQVKSIFSIEKSHFLNMIKFTEILLKVALNTITLTLALLKKLI
jgi:hypothetical protein